MASAAASTAPAATASSSLSDDDSGSRTDTTTEGSRTGVEAGAAATSADSGIAEKAQTSKTDSKEAAADDDEGENEDQKAFECNICLDVARDAVISLCGHLFCWPCLHQWLETRPNRQICPVCKAGISRDKVIPLYGRGNADQKDPRDKVPPRPRGQRPEPENTGGGGGAGFFSPFNMGNHGAGGFQMSFGIGAFPFGFFATNFNMGDNGGGHPHGIHRGGVPPGQGAQFEEEQFLHRVFLWVALAFIFWLMMA